MLCRNHHTHGAGYNFFFFSSRRRHTRSLRDWRSDVCSSDLRIEVIRGPGATLWGANAVNGVINITTKSAKDTQGVLLSGGAGSEEVGFGARYGAQVHENRSEEGRVGKECRWRWSSYEEKQRD